MMTREEAIQQLWEAATDQWEEPLAESLAQSATALPGQALRGKDLHQIGIVLGFLGPGDGEQQ